MPSNDILSFISKQLDDYKLQDITTIDVHEYTDVTDHIIIATATSKRHGIASCDKLLEALRAQKQKPLGVEGEDMGEWILIDMGDVVVHIMLAETRGFYDLEKLWDVEHLRQRHAQD